MHSITMYEGRDTQGASRSVVARCRAVGTGARLRDRGNTARPQQRCVRPAGRHALPGAAPLRTVRTAVEPLVRGESAAARLPAHAKRPPRARQAARRVARFCSSRSCRCRRPSMMSMPIEAYLSRLECELRERGVADPRIIDEVREHLVDAVEASLRRGLSTEAAEREALVRFGPPETIAAAFFSTSDSMPNRPGIVLSSLGGVLRGNPLHPRQYHVSSNLSRL